jgi:hypothetical protein
MQKGDRVLIPGVIVNDLSKPGLGIIVEIGDIQHRLPCVKPEGLIKVGATKPVDLNSRYETLERYLNGSEEER